jgi:hypothetical protein
MAFFGHAIPKASWIGASSLGGLQIAISCGLQGSNTSALRRQGHAPDAACRAMRNVAPIRGGGRKIVHE